jgi:anti-sigma regulatory factor (Ser/Thr protein kinase)
VVLLYRREEELIESVGAYLVDALRSQSAAVVVATAEHRCALTAWVSRHGVDAAAASAQGRLYLADAERILECFVVDGQPHPGRFQDVVGALLDAAGRANRTVYVYGEIVNLLWQAGQVNAAVAVETFWNDLRHRQPFSLWCAYAAKETGTADVGGEMAAFDEVCGRHSAVFGTTAGPRLGRSATATTKSFSADTKTPRAARHFVVEALSQLGSKEWLIDDAALVVTELTTNALLHAHSAATVNLWVNGDVVRVGVEDAAPVLPTQRPPERLGPSGRGLNLVAALSRQWGADFLDGGKVVWAELRR